MITTEAVKKIVIGLDAEKQSLQHVPLIYGSYQIGEQGGWLMDELAVIGLTTHMLAFLDRLEQATPLEEPIGPELVAQIEERAMNLAKQMLTPIFRQYGTSVDTAEVVLVALHLAAARERLTVSN